MDSFTAFIDETGNSDLDVEKSGSSRYFILCAVIIKNSIQNIFSTAAESIRKDYFQTGEIKSSGIRDKDNHKRRISILNRVLDLDFSFIAIVIDKERLWEDSGLKYKTSFIKFVNGLLYSHLFQTFPEIRIVADEHGGEEFKESFVSYMEERHNPDLFWKNEVELVSSTVSPGVQLADLLVGTIGKIYEKKNPKPLHDIFQKLINEKCLGLREWPTKYQIYFPINSGKTGYDQRIHSYTLAQAENYLQKFEKYSDEENMIRLIVLRFLVFRSRFDSNREYITSKELIDHLEKRGYENISDFYIRSNVISKLRDSGVLISSGNKGYKIPESKADNHYFVDMVNNHVIPLLDRLNMARKSFLEYSQNEIDILSGDQFDRLSRLLEVIDEDSFDTKVL